MRKSGGERAMKPAERKGERTLCTPNSSHNSKRPEDDNITGTVVSKRPEDDNITGTVVIGTRSATKTPTAEEQRRHGDKSNKKTPTQKNKEDARTRAARRRSKRFKEKTERESNEFGGKIEFVTKRQIRPTVSNQGEW